MATPRILVPIADGSEDIESSCIIDVLRRAKFNVVVTSVMPYLKITTARGMKIEADGLLEFITNTDFDAIVLPGGLPGAEHLRDSEKLIQLLKEHKKEGKLVAAICASPAVVFKTHDIITTEKATCFPAMQADLPTFVDQKVVCTNNIITSQGPATAMPFAVEIIRYLAGDKLANSVSDALLL